MKINENIFFSSLKGSVDAIKKNKGYFALLFFTQLAFLIVISAIFVYYAIAIGQNAEAVVKPLQESAALGPTATASLLEQSGVLFSAYNDMLKNIFMFIFLSFISYVFLNGVNWDIANLIVNKSSKFIRYQLMFGLSVFVFAAIAVLTTGVFLRFLAYIGNNQLVIFIAFLLFVAITYFSHISFGLINNYDLKHKKAFLKDTVMLGYKRFGTLLFSYFFMFLIIALFGGIVYFLLYAPMLALALSLIFLILAMNWGRIFFLTVVKNVAEKVKIKIV